MYAIIPQDCEVDIASYFSINKYLFKRIRNWLVYMKDFINYYMCVELLSKKYLFIFKIFLL